MALSTLRFQQPDVWSERDHKQGGYSKRSSRTHARARARTHARTHARTPHESRTSFDEGPQKHPKKIVPINE
eukprot:6425010-Amphidinium_carterae.1